MTSEGVLARLDERVGHMRRELDLVPDKIKDSEKNSVERLRYEIEQAFKLADGRNESAQKELEGRLKEHVTCELTAFEQRLEERMKGDWKRNIPMLAVIAAMALVVGWDAVWPFIRILLKI